MNRETVIQLLLGAATFTGLTLFVIPLINPTPARLVVIYLGATYADLQLAAFLAGKSRYRALIMASLAIVAAAYAVTVITF